MSNRSLDDEAFFTAILCWYAYSHNLPNRIRHRESSKLAQRARTFIKKEDRIRQIGNKRLKLEEINAAGYRRVLIQQYFRLHRKNASQIRADGNMPLNMFSANIRRIFVVATTQKKKQGAIRTRTIEPLTGTKRANGSLYPISTYHNFLSLLRGSTKEPIGLAALAGRDRRRSNRHLNPGNGYRTI